MTDVPLLPGAVGLSRLRVYPWPTEDGLHGGTPHTHLTCTECYVVRSGTGELHTLTADGPRRTPLAPGDAVWFTPGTIHRAVDVDRLDVMILMQNDGLPEAGDAVMTFPPEHLADPAAYRAAADLGTGPVEERTRRARERRDLAIRGYRDLVAAAEAGRTDALDDFYRAAVALVADRLPEWEKAWRERALAAAERTGRQIAALRLGDPAHLRDASVTRLPAPPREGLGMCGHLTAYHRQDASEV
ncbi:cupin domain-containing protein [Actinacidiphila acididurans]|uniref:Cupin domain-containing protein n=1 Tax=Actinacidiphila acididurans TaxID=2784346 RepID=A0ABS2U0D2_9ACTN|nr:cupin domain-containing protein [Actinacidiphila acididurans]MBM9509059.1 cupin domain-containing protein [Actinacidiphila acididurans]